MKKCPNCGEHLEDESLESSLCLECGEGFDESEAECDC
jgi:uncharacterized membrane protein YvbJ